jgi:hypothetical protein
MEVIGPHLPVVIIPPETAVVCVISETFAVVTITRDPGLHESFRKVKTEKKQRIIKYLKKPSS